MPKFLEEKLKKQYGASSDIPYKIMNKLGFMRGNKETAKGRAAESKHKKNPDIPGESTKEKEVDLIRRSSIQKNIDGDTINTKAKLFSTNKLMGSTHKGDLASGKPVTTSDKLMSDEHKRKRSEIDSSMNTTEGILRGSHKWNLRHGQDHMNKAKITKKLLDAHLAGKMAGKFLNSKGY